MKLTPLDQLPALETEPSSDWAYLTHSGTDHQGMEHQSLVLIYAARRDYLSVPKTYVVAEFFGNDSCPLEVHQMPRDNYLDEINVSVSPHLAGLYEPQTTENSSIALLIDKTTALEIEYGSLIQHQEIYYSANSKSALSEYIKQNQFIYC